MATTEIFDQLYKKLNTAQKKAVDTIDGPVMVVAGPGTGKTSILTLRIGNILQKTDTSPENILALTFTESGAYAMRKKLVEIIGTPAYKVTISTFHGFCNDIIKQYPERFPRIIGSTAVVDVDQIAIMEEIILNTDLELLKPYGDVFFYVRPVLGEIQKLKREDISVKDFEKGIEKQGKDFENTPEKIHSKGAHKGKMKGEFVKLQEQIQKNRELLQLYTAYQNALAEKKYYDFEDMIVEVVKTLANDADLLLILQETYQYILADEHQDANGAQNNLLKLLANFHESPNLFIVGDEKQAIFRFQGASLENFLYFKKLYPKATLINLEENYRSTQSILDASHSLILNNVNAAPAAGLAAIAHVKLAARAQKGKEPIQIHEFINADAEHAFVAEGIERKIKDGTPAEEIAVLYRNNNDSFGIGAALEKRGISFRVESDNDILKDEQIRKLLIIFECINDLSNQELLAKVLFIDFFEIEPLAIYTALAKVRTDKKKLYEIIGAEFPDVAEKLSSWASLAHNKPFVHVFETIIRESNFLTATLKSENSLERLATLEVFFEEARRLAGARKEYFVADFIRHLHRVREHGILTKTGAGNMKKGVRLMTAHRSKGLEFEFVYIIGAYDGHWGNKTQRNYFHVPLVSGASSAGIDDERRLFYVALTRARREVAITYARGGGEGEQSHREQLPAQFIGEIEESLKKMYVHDETISIKEHLSSQSKTAEIDHKEYLQKIFLEQGLSVTALNNYLKCPWEYFFVNLIRIPKAQDKHQMYGTAVHETLKTFFEKYRVEEDMSKKDFLKLFEFNLARLPLSPTDFEDTLKKGIASLGGYYDTYKNTWPRHLLAEFGVKGVHIESAIGTILLKGQLDKVEILDGGSAVNVVDYKTGAPKSRNHIEGKTKDANGNYKRQLVFYKLILDLDGKYNMRSGELDFIEPDSSGKYRKERFDILDSEVAELKKLVIEKAEEIYNFSFMDKNCGEKDCEYCELGRSLSTK